MITATDTATGPGPKERALEATSRLLDSQGVDVGLDAILREAQVARRSIYQHFGGKDQLVAQALERAGRKSLDSYQQALARGGTDPLDRLMNVFADLASIVGREGYAGCRYLRADLALSDRSHPAHAVVRNHKREVRNLLLVELESLGHPDPPAAAADLQFLIDGALTVGASRPEDDVAATAQRLARVIIAAD
jgi:AcrR family transcriptional regulator